MYYTIHHMIFEGTRPFDLLMLVLEALVFLLIAIEVGLNLADRIGGYKRKNFLKPKRAWLPCSRRSAVIIATLSELGRPTIATSSRLTRCIEKVTQR